MSTLRNVKPQRSFRRPPRQQDDEKDTVGVHSEPHMVHLARHQTTTGNPSHGRRPHHHQGSVREKGKGRRSSRQELPRNKSANDLGAKPGKPFEPWPMWNNGAAPGPSKNKSTDTGLQVPPCQPSRVTSPLPSPVGSSQVTTPVGEYPSSSHPSPDSERPRSRVMRWVSILSGGHRQASYASSLNSPMIEAGTSLAHGRSHPVPATAPPSRDSVDALSGHVTSRQSSISMGGQLTKAMRAASWTAPEFAQVRPSEDLTSLYSADRGDEVDEETLMWGAGGIAHSPVPSMPNSALLSTVSSVQSIGPAMFAAQAILSRTEAVAAEVPEPSHQDPGAHPHTHTHTHSHSHSHHHSHSHSHSHSHPRHTPTAARQRAISPLACVTFNPDQTINGSESEDEDGGASYDSADDDSSTSFRHRGRQPGTAGIIHNQDVDADLDESSLDGSGSGTGSGGSFELQPSTSQMYRDEDEESADEDEVRIEVRPRRASQSATEMSPPRRSLSTHRPRERERPMICT